MADQSTSGSPSRGNNARWPLSVFRSAPARFSRVEGEAAFVAILALLVGSIFVVTPLEANGTAPSRLLEAIRLAIATLIFLIVAKRRRSRLAIVGTFAATVLVFSHLHPLLPDGGVARPLVALAFELAIAIIIAAATFAPGFVSTRRILGGIIIYLCIALVFAHGYMAVQMSLAGAFASGNGGAPSFADLLQYSLANLTSIGESRLQAVHPMVRSFAQFETVVGQLFPATLLARLVAQNAAALARPPRAPGSHEEPMMDEDAGGGRSR